MHDDGAQVSQCTGIMLLRLYGVAFLLALLCVDPAFAGTALGTAMLIAGGALVVVGVFGGCWAIAHIGGRKNVELIRSGPYRHSRNPLYFFSIVAWAGFGAMSQSIALAAAIALAALIAYYAKIGDEERYLCRKFGDDYLRYARSTPRLFPRPGRAAREPAGARRRLPYRQILDTLGVLLFIPLVLVAESVRDWQQLAVLALP